MEAGASPQSNRDPSPFSSIGFIERLRQRPPQGAVIWMDLDGASLANRVLLPDTLERLLAELVAVLKSALPPGSHVARCGCDEFGAHVSDPKHATATAEFVRSIIQAMWKRERAQMLDSIVEGAPVNVLTLSVGVAHYVRDTVDMVREAQAMCDVAKRAGGNRVIARGA